MTIKTVIDSKTHKWIDVQVTAGLMTMRTERRKWVAARHNEPLDLEPPKAFTVAAVAATAAAEAATVFAFFNIIAQRAYIESDLGGP